MDISYKWLKRLIDFPYDARQLAAVLTSLGLECDTVEEVESIRGGLRGVVIGKVLTCEAHPDSDHLHVTTVDLGTGTPEQIVCGAPNVAAGQTVVVATLGTVLYQGDKEFKIKKSKIRGVESSGMICAEDELGLGTSHDGIMVLPEGCAAPGTPAADYFELSSDWRLEVELTPNRVDAASHYGVARDLRAYLARHHQEGALPEIRLPQVESFRSDRADGAVKVTVEDSEGAPRYSGITVRNVKVGESPKWLRELLIAAGQRPINNVVDITNFILLGLGQPLHCFDLGKMAGEEVVVRSCPEGSKFTTLDGVERTLSAKDLMICDVEKPMCIAGVFGGLESGVTEATTDVFIESAWFNSTRVRKTARRHGLSTDASFRYERGTDPAITVYAAKLAALLIKELCGGEICGEVVDIRLEDVIPAECDLSLDYVDSLIGQQIPEGTIRRILEALEIQVAETETPRVWHLSIPRYRVDVTRPCDVVEEILRVYGYDDITAPGHSLPSAADESEAPAGKKAGTMRSDTDLFHEYKNLISEQLTAQGFNEILNNSLTAASYYADNGELGSAGCVTLMNPLSGDLSVLRRTLLYGGLEVIAHNVNRKATDLRLYEFGHVYSQVNPEAAGLKKYEEREMLGIWLTGNIEQPSWNRQGREATVYDLKAVTDNVLARLGVNPREVVTTIGSDELFSGKLSLTMRSGKPLAEVGLVKGKQLKRLGVEVPVAYAAIYWEEACKAAKRHKTEFKPLPKTMAVKRDLSLLLDSGVTMQQVEQAVQKAERKLLRDIALFDVYEGKNLPAGKKSYAIKMTLQDDEKTLTDKQIDQSMQRIVDSLKKELGAELR